MLHIFGGILIIVWRFEKFRRHESIGRISLLMVLYIRIDRGDLYVSISGLMMSTRIEWVRVEGQI